MISQLIGVLSHRFALDQNPYRCADFGRMFDATLFSGAKKKIALRSICQGEVRCDEGVHK